MKQITVTLVALTFLVAALLAACPIKPNFIVKTSPTGSPSAGQTVTLQVGLNQPATGTQAVSIAASDPSQFSSLPTTVFVADGQTTQTFQATLSSTATGGCNVEASCNGFSANFEVPQIGP